MILQLRNFNISRIIKSWIQEHKLLFVILILGFILRILPILWGVPLNPHVRGYHPDEPKSYRTILNFPSLSTPFKGYGTTVQYVLGVLLLPVKVFMVKLMGRHDAYAVIALVLSRLASVLLGTGTVYLIYRLGNELFDKKVAILSAALLATSFYHTLNSALITLDVSMSFMLTANFLLCFKAFTVNRKMAYVHLGVATGLLMGTKFTGGMFFIIPCILTFLKYLESDLPPQQRKGQLFEQINYLLTYVGVALIIFAFSNPHPFVFPARYISWYLHESHMWIDRLQVSLAQMLFTWARNTTISLGLPVTILAVFGALIPGRKNLQYKAMLLIFLTFYYGLWRWLVLPRYLITVAPLFCLFAANGCMILANRKNVLLKMVGIGVISISLGYSLYLCTSGILIRSNDTRTLAARYIAKTIPAGTSVGLSYVSEKYTWKTHSWQYPKVDFQRYKEVSFLEGPDIVILSDWDFYPILETLNSDKFKLEYVLDEAYYRDWYRYSAPSPRIFRFYDELLNKKTLRYALLNSFKIKQNVPVEFSPPEIRIYKKASE